MMPCLTAIDMTINYDSLLAIFSLQGLYHGMPKAHDKGNISALIPWLRIWLGDSQLQRCCYGATWDVVSSRNGPCHVDKTKEDG